MELNIHEKFNATLKEMMARKAPKDEIQKLIDDYRAQKDATVKSPESKTEVKKDDFVSSIPGLKEKLVKTQETKTPEASNLPENVTEKSINRTRLGAVAGNGSTASTQFQKAYVDPITGRNTPATYNPSFQPTLDGWNGKYTKNKTKDDSHLRNVDGTTKVSEDKLLDFHMTTPYVESQAKKKKNVDKVLSAGEQTYRLFGDEASRIAEYNDKLYPTINNYLPFEDGTFPQHNSAYGATQQLLHIENSLTEDTKIVQDRLAESYFGLDGFVRERVEGKKSGIGEGAWIARKFDNMVQGLIGEPEEKYYKNSEEYDLKNFFARKLDDGTDSYDKYDQYLEWKETKKFNPSWMDNAKKSVIINRVRQEKSEQHINDYPNNSEIKNTIREIKDNNIIAIFEPDETNYIAEYKEAIEVDKQRLLEIQKLEGSFMNWTTTDQEKLMSLRDKESEKSKVLNKYYEDKFKEYETEATDFEKDHKTYEDFYNKYNPLSESIEYRFKQLGEVSEYSSDEKKEKWNKLVAEFNELKASYDKDFLASGINEEELFKRQDALNNKRSKIIDNFDKTNNSLAVSRALALDYDNTNYFSLSLEQALAGDIGSGLTGALKLFAFAADKVVGYGELLASGRNIGSRQIKKVWNTDQDGNLTKYRNLHNAQISYKESMENYKQTAMPLTIPWKDVNMNNMLEWSGRALSDNVFSIGTALSYGTAIGLGARIPQATKVLSGIFFSVEAGSKLGQMEIEQKNAPKNIAELKKAKESAVTNDERINIQSQIDYQEKALDATEMEKAFSSIMYGGIAMYAERLGTMRTLRNLSRVAATSGRVSVANTLKGSFQVAKGAATEYVEETVTQIGHNIVDNVVVGQNKSLLDGIDADFNANVIFSSLAIMGPSVSANVYNSIRSEVITQAEIAKNRQRQKDLVEVMEPLQNDKKSGGKLLDKANRDFLESEGERILREASLVDATMFADIADMTASELKELFSVNQKKRDKLNQLRNLGSQSSYEQVNSSYIEKQKQKITNELNELNGKRDQLRGEPSGRRKEAIEKSIKEKDKIQVDTEFYLGRFHGNMNIVKGLAGNTKTFGKVLDDGTLDLTDLEKYLDKKVEKGSITEEEKKDYLKGFRGGNYASFVGNDVIVIQHNVIKAINEAKTSLEKSMIAYAPLHELQHINDINSGLIVDNEVVESQAVVIQGVENEIETLYEQGKITEENYIIIKNRINSYARNNDELRNKAALSRFGERFENLNKAQQDEVLKIYPKRTSVDLMELLTIAGELKDAGILSENSTDLLLSLKLMINGLSNRYFKKGAMFFKLNSTSDVLGYIDSFQRSARSQNLILGPEEEAKNAKFSSALESINNLIPSDIKTKEDYQEFVRDRKRFAPLGKALEENGVISNYVKSKSVGDEYVDAMESVTDRVIGLRGTFNPERLREDGTKVGKEAFGEFIFANTNFAKRDAKKALAIRKIESDKTTSIDTKEAREIEDQSTIDESTSGRSDGDTKKINVLKFTGVSSKINELMDVIDIMPVGNNTFKTVDEYTGKAAEIIFDIPAEKATKGDKNLSHRNRVVNGMMELSQAGKIQNFYRVEDNLEKLVKIMVPENVTQKTGDISEVGENVDVARDIYGRSIGLKGKVLEYFFDKTGKRSQGLTTQPSVWELKPEFKNPSKETLDKLRSDLGITPQGQANVSDRAFNGQLLKGIAEYQAYQTALSITQRKLDAIKQEAATKEEKSAISQDIANVTAAQSKVAFSSAIDKIVDNVGNIEINFELEQKHINKVLSFHLGEEAVIYDFKTKDNIDDFFSVVREVVIPSLPKELAQSGLFFKSDRHLGKSKNKIVTIEGKKIKLKDYYKQQRDKLFESLKDEDYGKPFTGAGAKYKYGIKYATYFGTTADEIERTNKKGKKIRGNKGNPVVMTIAQTNEMHMSMHEQLWQRVNTSIRKNPKINAPVWGNYFSFVGNNTEHPHRMGAEFIGWSINPLGYDGKLYEWEHAMPATRAYLYLIHASLGGYDFKTTYGLVQNNYKLIALDNYDDKIKLKGAKRTTSMGEGWTMLDDFFDRYFDEVVAAIEGGIDPKGIMHTTGKTFDKVYNVNSDGNHIIVKPGINSSSKFSKAIGTSRTVDPAKGISVLDFDDTLATTKSGVRYTLPNPDGLPQPKKKVIFMAGGPGSGKSNVINQLGLKGQGFKVVNQDISLEWLMKNHGMPTDMREFTPEQASEFGKLSAEARGIALKKRIKYQGEGDGVIIDGTGASLNVMKKNIKDFQDKGYDVQMIFVETSQETALSRNKARKERSLRTGIVIKTHDSVQANKEAYKELFGERFAEVNTDNLKQGDIMPADVVNKVNDFTSGYIKGRLNAGEYATKGEELRQQGAEFDFSEFNQVVEGKTAPLFNKAMKLQEKFTSKDMFVLTARPAESNQAIFEFLQANGLNIPIENIVGLGSSLSSDKALWMAGKVGEGYNDFYFADDILENVQAVSDMLEQFDVKSKVQQAKRDFVLGDPKVTKLLDEKSMNDVKDVDGLANPGVYSNVKFSKSHRAEYENTVAKNRPDLSGKEVTATIDKMFEYIDGLDVPNKRKYEQITTKWLATSNIKLPEDSYKIQQAVEIAELKKEDIFSYKNPNEIIEKYAGTIKVKPISPVGIKEFTRATGINDPITTEYGIVEYEVEETREAQQKVRDIVNTHWGPNSNPWCITKIDKDGNLSEDAWRDWTSYGKGPKRIVFQNGKLLAMKANYEYWGKMNKHSKGPIIQVKEGNVTNTTELVVGDGGIVDPIIRETRTVSKDGNTVTTNIFEDSQDGYADGTTIVENRIKGVKTKETRFDPDGSKVSTQEFNKKGKPTTSYQFNPNGKVKSINGHLQQQAITEAGLDVNAREDADIDLTNELVVKVGDIIENNYTETETDGTTTDYFYGRALVGDQVMEIGFESKTGLDLADVTKTIDGKTRLDIGKVIREVDPNVKGLPKTGVKFSKGISKEFNDIIEQSTGVGSEKVFSDAQAKIRGNKMRFDNIVPYSVQDLMGLLYNFVGKGKVGEQHMEFFKKALIDPFARAINELNQSKQSSAGDYRNLTKAFPNVKKKLNKEVESGDYTYDQAIRVYLWNKAGFEVPGLSKRDLNTLDSIVKNDPELQAFADTLGLISKKEEGYAKPGEHWLVENIASDLLSDGSIGDARSEFLAEWQQNADEMFSKENLNKIQAIYGNKFREALEDILYRMKYGTNRPTGSSRLTNNFMNWINNSTGAIMFFNMRSALLQTLSTTNYINWTDNNPLKAAMAFADQKQYWSDFSALFNSDFLKQRRSGNQRSINEAELTTAVANSDNKAKAALAWLLQKGFLPTQIMDSFAISAGGATFYRNRINKYIKEGMSPEQAQEKAFLDFQEITEATQQSARPDMISQQQASPLGRLILSFQNTPMQYARIMNKAARDIVNGRGDQKSNISKIVYYGALQSIIFAALQSAIFASLGDDEEEEFDKKKQRIVGSMVDGWLAGLGVAGKAIGTIERSIKEYLKQKERGFNADHAQTIIQLLGFSPPIGSKLRKIYSAIQTEEFNKGVSEKRGFTLDNPTWSSWGNVIEGFTNIPLGRISNKLLNIDNALDSQNQWWERAALLLGWNTWDLGIKDPDIIAVKGEIKEERKVEKKEEALIKKEEKKKEVEEENISKEKANIELQKKEIEDGNKSPDCAAINKRGERCGTKIEKGSTYCTVHTKVEQNDGGKKTQCGKTKKDGKRCKMQTSNKSGYCYYHD
jgi:hypothetical protein